MEENTIDTTDRISMLPDSIVHHILSYLMDDPKSRGRLSVLSKQWFALTASCRFLYFCCDSLSSSTFCKYVEYTVSRFCKQNISAHTLKISTRIQNSEEIKLFERCVGLVIAKGLQMMDIQFNYIRNMPMVRLPDTLLSASSLTSLRLHKCELPSSLIMGVVKFKSLRLLSLSNLQLDEGVIEYLTKGCPLLEEIYLKYCYGLKTICVKRHQNLLKVMIFCVPTFLLERIDVDAPNLSYFLLDGNKDKTAPSMFLDSCKKLTTFCYRGFPLTRFNDFLSNFQLLENVALDLPYHINNLKLSNHCLKNIRLQTQCHLDDIVFNAPNLHLFEYFDNFYFHDFPSLSNKYWYLSKRCMKCQIVKGYSDILWFKKLRYFLEKSSILQVLKLLIHWELTNVEELKLIELPPYKLEHVELDSRSLRKLPVYVALLDVVLWCFRPRSLTLKPDDSINLFDVVKFTYEKLLQQECQGQTNSIKFVLIYGSVEQHFSDLNSFLKALYHTQSFCEMTFIKEEVFPEEA